MSDKHTPGPWEAVVSDYDMSGYDWRIQTDDYLVAYVTGVGKGNGYTRVADARLIAAAPDLLAACDDVQRAWCGDGIDMATAVDAVLAAIAKATGSGVHDA